MFKPGMLVKLRGSYPCMSWDSEEHNTIERKITTAEIGLVIKCVDRTDLLTGHDLSREFLVLFGEKIELVLSGYLERLV